MRAEYNVTSGPIPSIQLKVPPGEDVMVSAGSYLGANPLHFSHETDRFQSDRGGVFSVLASGESLYVNTYTNVDTQTRDLLISDEQIGTVIDVSDELDTGILCLSGSFVAATGDVDIGFKRVRSFAEAALTSQSMWMQRCKNRDPERPASVFLMAATQPVEVELDEGEPYMVDNNALYAMTEGMRLRLYENEGLVKALGGGEGRFQTVVEGPGKVWVAPDSSGSSSSAVSRILDMIIPG